MKEEGQFLIQNVPNMNKSVMEHNCCKAMFGVRNNIIGSILGRQTRNPNKRCAEVIPQLRIHGGHSENQRIGFFFVNGYGKSNQSFDR